MSGRHGRMSDSPFFIQSIRSLASQKYDDVVNREMPPCKYRNKCICRLPQNKKDYNKKCAPYRCLYIGGIPNHMQKRRNTCVFSYKNKCFYNSALNGCTETNDLAYCCGYYIDIKEKPDLRKALVSNYELTQVKEELSNTEKSIKKKQEFISKLEKRIDKQCAQPTPNEKLIVEMRQRTMDAKKQVDCLEKERIRLFEQLRRLK